MTHDGSMGRTVYLPTGLVDFYCFHAGKYTVRPMDPMGKTLGADGASFDGSLRLIMICVG